MVSDFRKKKLLHVFNSFFDRNASGSIDKSDFDLATENISKMRGWSAGDAKYKEVQSTLLKIWEGLQSRADVDKDGQISEDEWIAMWEEYAKNPASPFEWQTLYCKFIFQLEDASGDGSIDGEEFSSVYASFGLSKDDALAAFRNMSKGKANVSWSEFQELWKEYFTTEDPNAPGNFIFGKTKF
ncbi:sarcoplasmic calcium-binding proteins II, V, VI, and VII-like [Maniola hyperantus]|uniref:sarcoplasmic calcium-binding proteins II, V, VI, and VII-like n=1 Tax=Aphantopus hyperantus TaxID=2795564 RepID=UPI001567DCF4|nr:sarcoplasmic calcium-binding proteins II, V, VI, and VII-like [Maniola hyperantus]